MSTPPPPGHKALVPRPLATFQNATLRDSIAAALDAVPPDHARAVLDVDNKGLGVMLAHRDEDGWAVVLGGRFSFEDKGVSARLAVSWP